MDTDRARDAIASVVPFEVGDVVPISGGWAFWTFEVDRAWIFRFPQSDEVGRAAETELRLLPALAKHVDFRVPVPSWRGTLDERTYFGYEKIAGRPLSAADVKRNPDLLGLLAAMLRELHSFDAGEAERLLGMEGSLRSWQSRYRDLRNDAIPRVAGLADPRTATLMATEFDRLLDGTPTFAPVLVHQDLGTEHILIDEATSRPVGMIDFEDAGVGDPAIDFVGFWITLGPDTSRRLIASYRSDLGPDFVQRVEAYWWLGSLHAVLYGLDRNDENIVEDGLAGLRERLEAVAVRRDDPT